MKRLQKKTQMPNCIFIRLVNGITRSKSSPFKRYAVIKDDVALSAGKKKYNCGPPTGQKHKWQLNF